MSGRNPTAWTATTAIWSLLRILGLLCVAAGLVPVPASAQAADCAALRARIDAGAPDASRVDPAIRQARTELDRVRAEVDDGGCNAGSVFDDPDSPECHALLQRAEDLGRTIARLSVENPQGGGDEDRRAAIDAYDASCTGSGDDASLPTPDAVVPVDPDTSAAPAPNPAPPGRIARVLCVRHCDGAFYPLAVDVPTDKLAGLDQLCQAQCPQAQSSAYSDIDGDVGKAQASDGTTYAALPAAFQFQKATSPTCACRAPGESWAQTLANAQAMIEAQKGDVLVTPEIQARMALPQPAPQTEGTALKPAAVKLLPKRARTSPPKTPPAVDAETANPGQDLMREFRRSVPTL